MSRQACPPQPEPLEKQFVCPQTLFCTIGSLWAYVFECAQAVIKQLHHVEGEHVRSIQSLHVVGVLAQVVFPISGASAANSKQLTTCKRKDAANSSQYSGIKYLYKRTQFSQIGLLSTGLSMSFPQMATNTTKLAWWLAHRHANRKYRIGWPASSFVT